MDQKPLNHSLKRVSVCHISSVGANVRSFFRGQFRYLQNKSFDFTVVTSELTRQGLELPDEVEYVPVPLLRSITPIEDIRSVFRLYRLFRSRRFDLVQYTTPKGALIGCIAAWLARVPVRLYLLWGIYYMGQHGAQRLFFKGLERICCCLSTHVTFDGYELRRFAIADGIVDEAKCDVIGEGSDNGVDLELFNRNLYITAGDEIRQRYKIPAKAIVIGGVMRLVGDKGINELVAAFEEISQTRPNVYLLLVGQVESRNAPQPETMLKIQTHPRIIAAGFQDKVCPFYAAMDIFSLPTYREGFSGVNLEAAAMGLPVVTTDAVGAKDSIVDGQTGLCIPAKCTRSLATALAKLADDSDLRRRMGLAGRKWIEDKFEQRRFWELLWQQRQGLLIASGLFKRDGEKIVRAGKP